MLSLKFFKQRQRFVGMFLVPIVTLGSVCVIADRWLAAGRVPGFTINQCQTKMLVNSSPADVLLLGSSRLGLAIDSEVVSEHVNSDSDKVDKLMIISSQEVNQNHALREYIANRGAPETLGIELSIDRKVGDENDPLLLYRSTPWTLAVTSFATHLDFFSDALRTNQFKTSDFLLKSKIDNPLSATLRRIELGFVSGIRQPSRVQEPLAGCKFDYFKMFKNGWAEPMPDDHQLPTDQLKQRLRESAGRVPNANLQSRRSAGEISLLNDMIRVAREAGTKNIFLMYFPDFDEDPSIMNVETISELIPQVPLFDVRDVFASGDPRIKFQFLDWRHMNSYGAWDVSVKLANFIELLRTQE